MSTVLSDGRDFYSDWNLPIRASTAANNSARFPGIGAAGSLKRNIGANSISDRIVDGGYFENFGATTGQDVLQAIAKLACPDTEDGCRLRPIVIQISSDPDYKGVVRDRISYEGDRGDETVELNNFAAEIRSPIAALLRTRTSRGVLSAQLLHDWTEAQHGDFIELRLLPPSDDHPGRSRQEPPLGWALSEQAQIDLNCQLFQERNLAELSKLAGEDMLTGFDVEAAIKHSKAICPHKGT